MELIMKTAPKIPHRLKLSITLMASLLFSISLLVFRIWYSGNFDYTFLVWNLFLAFIPFAISTILILREEKIQSFFVLLMPITLWLIFFPNAPYILTDLFHLKAKNYVPLWYDLAIILSFAWNGLMLGFISLADIQKILTKRFNSLFGWTFAILAIVLGSFGVYIGRYLRWNSWDILTSPLDLVYDITERILNPLIYPRAWAMTIIFSAFLSLCYLLIKQVSAITENA